MVLANSFCSCLQRKFSASIYNRLRNLDQIYVKYQRFVGPDFGTNATLSVGQG
jgi:hypothetical protein